jgi:hypothetical protein
MIAVKKEGILLKKSGLGFENEGVLNPAVIADETPSVTVNFLIRSPLNTAMTVLCYSHSSIMRRRAWKIRVS